MATNSKIGQAPTKPTFWVTYGTGGVESPASLHLMSLPKFHEGLLTQHQAETEALDELWEPFTSSTRQKRFLQHQKIEATFPFVVASVTYNKKADLADEEDYHAGWRWLSGVVVLQFKYGFVKGNAVRTAKRRELLQKQLLATPLIGPSIVLMPKVPGECMIYVFIAAGTMKSYWSCVCTITSYLKAAFPKLHQKLYEAAPNANERYSIGFDPLAYLRPRPVEGYATFPVKQAQAATVAGEQQQAELTRKRREERRKKK